MKSLKPNILLCALTLWLAVHWAVAQPPPTRSAELRINAIRQRVRQAPSYSGNGLVLGGKGTHANRPWYHIEVDFASDLDWADDVLLKYYVLVGRGEDAKLLVGEVTHVNVKRGQRNYSAMFLHPSTLDRYGRGRVEAVAVQLFHNNRLMDQLSDPPARTRWWERFTPVPGFLLRVEETPWSVVAHERYEASKPPR